MSVAPLGTPVAIEAAYPDVKASTFGFFPIPITDNQLQPVHPAGPSKFIYSKSPRVEQAKQFITFLTQPENLQYLLDNEPHFASLPFTGLQPKWDEEQTAFLERYEAKTPVYQDVVNYLNPQWIDIGQGHGRDVHRRHDPSGCHGQHRSAASGDGRDRGRSRLAGLTIA